MSDNKILSARELRRYAPQMNLSGIGEEGQIKLKKSKILVIGAGGKGTMALKNLITAGVGFIGICDDTLIQEDTLGRQSLYGDNDIGKQKAIVSKQYLRARNQFTDIKVHNIRLTADNLNGIISDYDILIDATNNDETHINISKASSELKKPVVYGNIINNTGLVALLNLENTILIEELLTKAKFSEKETIDKTTPVVIINSLMGVVLANEALKIILGIDTTLKSNLLLINANTYSFKLISYSR